MGGGGGGLKIAILTSLAQLTRNIFCVNGINYADKMKSGTDIIQDIFLNFSRINL